MKIREKIMELTQPRGSSYSEDETVIYIRQQNILQRIIMLVCGYIEYKRYSLFNLEKLENTKLTSWKKMIINQR